jgi:hypothetical protein
LSYSRAIRHCVLMIRCHRFLDFSGVSVGAAATRSHGIDYSVFRMKCNPARARLLYRQLIASNQMRRAPEEALDTGRFCG